MEVKIVDINIPFWSLVGLLVKVALASIPATLILAALYFAAALVLGGCLAAVGAAIR